MSKKMKRISDFIIRVKRRDVINLRKQIDIETIKEFINKKYDIPKEKITQRVFDEICYIKGLFLVTEEAKHYLLEKRKDGLKNMTNELNKTVTRENLVKSLKDKGYNDIANIIESEGKKSDIVPLSELINKNEVN